MATCPADFPGYEKCEKIDACEVDAYVSLDLDPENPTGVILDSSWGTVRVDLESIVKAGETITHMELVPENNPTAIRYTRESGEVDCITGDELSRIVSMHLLKDVDQTTPPSDGIVYMYNGNTNLFENYDLKTVIGGINATILQIQGTLVNLQNQITAIGNRVTTLENKVTTLETKVSDIEGLIYNYPADKTTKIPRGDINLYSDYTNTNSKAHGFFTHNPNTDVANDEYFA